MVQRKLCVSVSHRTQLHNAVSASVACSCNAYARSSSCLLNVSLTRVAGNHDPPNCPPALCQCDTPGPSPSPSPPVGPPVVGAYHDLSSVNGLKELSALAASAATLPITRLYLAFVAPTLVYVPGSRTLAGAGMGIPTTSTDAGFAKVAEAVSTLEAAGVETFLSMGGWNYNCFPALYMRSSIAGYGEHTPNYWKIDRFGGPSNCTAENQYCYVCEPPSEHASLRTSFSVFPEPAKTASWQAATAYVEKWAADAPTPVWHPEVIPGKLYTDPALGFESLVPGSGEFDALSRDPYHDLVLLAKDLNCSGVDLDYEEFWHADSYKNVAAGGTAADGPWVLHQTTYKSVCPCRCSGLTAPLPLLRMAASALHMNPLTPPYRLTYRRASNFAPPLRGVSSTM